MLHKPTGTPYALKCMRKGQIIALKQVDHVMNEKHISHTSPHISPYLPQVDHVMNEKQILEMCDHPFLLTLAASYQVRGGGVISDKDGNGVRCATLSF